MNIGSTHVVVTSDSPVPAGPCRLGMRVRRLTRERPPKPGTGAGITQLTLLINGVPSGSIETPLSFVNFVSWSGLDIGRDRSSPVGDYVAPFEFTGALKRVTVVMDDDQALDADGVARAQMARQ
jgi:hypothetical protein